MKIGNIIILAVGLVVLGSFIYRTIRQLATGKALARGGRVIATRRTNPMLYWSSMIIEILVAAGAVGLAILAIYTLIDWHSLWH